MDSDVRVMRERVSADELSLSARLCILTSSLILAGWSVDGDSVSRCFCRRCLADVMFILVSAPPRPPRRR